MCGQLHLTLCDPMDYSPPGSSVHGIFQARILKCAPSYWRGARVLYTHSCACAHTCTRTHTHACTEARWDVGHRLECLRPGVAKTQPSRQTLPDWTEMYPPLACLPTARLCQSDPKLSRLLFGFPRICLAETAGNLTL